MKYIDDKCNIKSFYKSEANMISAGYINIRVADCIERDDPNYKKHMVTRAKHKLGMELAEKSVKNIDEYYDNDTNTTHYNMGAIVIDVKLAFKLFKNIKDMYGDTLPSWSSDLIDYILKEIKGE